MNSIIRPHLFLLIMLTIIAHIVFVCVSLFAKKQCILFNFCNHLFPSFYRHAGEDNESYGTWNTNEDGEWDHAADAVGNDDDGSVDSTAQLCVTSVEEGDEASSN